MVLELVWTAAVDSPTAASTVDDVVAANTELHITPVATSCMVDMGVVVGAAAVVGAAHAPMINPRPVSARTLKKIWRSMVVACK